MGVDVFGEGEGSESGDAGYKHYRGFYCYNIVSAIVA